MNQSDSSLVARQLMSHAGVAKHAIHFTTCRTAQCFDPKKALLHNREGNEKQHTHTASQREKLGEIPSGKTMNPYMAFTNRV